MTRSAPPPLPGLRFDPEIDISPFALFRRLREGRPPVLFELRPAEGGEPDGWTLRGARPLPADPREWIPPDEEAVIFDRDGTGSRELVVALRSTGRAPRLRALFGGLRLYDFALDPLVVGTERSLVTRGASGR